MWFLFSNLSLTANYQCYKIRFLLKGLKINYTKSCLFGVGVESVESESMANRIGCKSSNFPCMYLGLTLGANMNRLANWKPVLDEFDKRLSLWKASVLSIGGRLTLLKAVMEALPSYYFSLFKAPGAIIKKLEAKRRNFFWGGNEDKNKLNWVKWNKVCAPKEAGGLGLTPLRDANIALLSKWWWRFKIQPDTLWNKVIRAFHSNNRSWPVLPFSRGLSGVWSTIAKLGNYLAYTNLNLNNMLIGVVGKGDKIRLWLDPWVSSQPLRNSFPNLFLLESNKDCLILDRYEEIGSGVVWKWKWKKRNLNQLELNELCRLDALLQQFALSQRPDQWRWLANKDGFFRSSQ
ncbi:hypothetical protein HanOQP8_Chr13g0484851 [Helianthus annuus]|nr:hypothetical protein HanHA89_Chr13g0516131 [Helianthus annuus]KAJ0671380.1 hypothetical protein HanOQP8_Chr13g0484851 [Helianthus annuus]